MQATQHQQIQNYLIWLQERGQCWPMVGSLNTEPGSIAHSEPNPPSSTDSTQAPEHQGSIEHIATSPQQPSESRPAPTSQTSQRLFRSAGLEQAPYLGIVDCIQGQKLVFGHERELLIKILSALGIDLKSQFRLLGLETDHCSAPLASYEEYKRQLVEIINQAQPKSIFCFGRMPYRIISGDSTPFVKVANTPTKADQSLPTIFPMYHLCELNQSPELKKQTWHGLRNFMGIR